MSMSFEDVIKYWGDEIEELGYGRRRLREWLSERLSYEVSEYFAREILEALSVDDGPEPIEVEEESIENKLRSVYGITDESWVPVTMWGEPDSPRAKWERRFNAASAQRVAEIVDALGGVVDQDREYIEADDKRLVVLSIRDVHFGMFTDHAAPYDTYDLDEASRHYVKAGMTLLKRSRDLGASEVVIPVGSDLLHVDGPDNATTKGTQQDVSTAWWRAFEAGLHSINLVVQAAQDFGFHGITLLLEPGNHDHNMAQALGFALRGKWEDEVGIITSPNSMKMVGFGGTKLFFHHGDSMKPEQYHGILLNDYRQEIADAEYIEVLSGHLHHRRKSVLKYPGDYLEDGGIVYRITPALCPPSNWTEQKGYRSVPGAVATIYDSTGFVGLFEYLP